MRQGLIACMQSYRNDHILGFIEFPEKSENVPVFFHDGAGLTSCRRVLMRCFWPFKDLNVKKAKLFFGLNIECKSEDFSNNVALLMYSMKRCFSAGATYCFGHSGSPRGLCLLLKGASYLIMPSFYEPFRSATEGFISGTPVVARATVDCGSR